MNASLETYDKLRGGGFSDEQARALSEAIGEAGQQRRLGAIEQRLTAVEARLDGFKEQLDGFKEQLNAFRQELAAFKRELTLQRWALGLVVASNLAILVKLFI